MRWEKPELRSVMETETPGTASKDAETKWEDPGTVWDGWVWIACRRLKCRWPGGGLELRRTEGLWLRLEGQQHRSRGEAWLGSAEWQVEEGVLHRPPALVGANYPPLLPHGGRLCRKADLTEDSRGETSKLLNYSRAPYPVFKVDWFLAVTI